MTYDSPEYWESLARSLLKQAMRQRNAKNSFYHQFAREYFVSADKAMRYCMAA